MKNRILGSIFMLCMLIALTALFPVAANAAANGTCGDNLTWTLDDNGNLTISGTGAMTEYASKKAPWYSNRYKIKTIHIENGVTSISKYAFYECLKATTATISDTVTSVGNFAFSSCSALESFTIGKGLTSIPSYVFSYCTSLTSITIPEHITSIESYAFFQCTGLTALTIPDNVTSIGSSAFKECTGLQSLSTGNGVTSIGSRAFSDCDGLKTITLGKNVTDISDYAFWGCSYVETVYWNAKNVSDFTSDYNVFTDIGYYSDGVDIIFGDEVEHIPAYAFSPYSCRRLTPYSYLNISSVTFGKNIKSIGNYAFSIAKKRHFQLFLTAWKV